MGCLPALVFVSLLMLLVPLLRSADFRIDRFLKPRHAELPDPLDPRDLELARYYAANEPSVPSCHEAHNEERHEPLAEVLARAKAQDPQMDGSCYFGAMPSCAVAHRARNFYEFSTTWPSSYTALVGATTPSWRDAQMETEARVFVYDAEYCLATGWLDASPADQERLLQNYDMLQSETAQECAIYVAAAGNITAAEAGMVFPATDAEIARQEQLPPAERPGFMGKENIFKHQVFHCLMDTADCMRHFCMWNFCRLPSGRIGMGRQCRENFRLKPRA